MSLIDLNNPPPNHKFSVSVEREETGAERRVRLFKDVALFTLAVGFVVVLAVFSYSTLTSSITSPEEKRWAMAFLSAAAAGLIGFLVRK